MGESVECERQFDTGSGSFSLSWRTKSPLTHTGRKHSMVWKRYFRCVCERTGEGTGGHLLVNIEEMKRI